MLFTVRTGFHVHSRGSYTPPGGLVAMTAADAAAHLHKLEAADDEAAAFLGDVHRKSTIEPADGATLSLKRKA